MEEKWIKAARYVLTVLTVVGAVGYGIGIWKDNPKDSNTDAADISKNVMNNTELPTESEAERKEIVHETENVPHEEMNKVPDQEYDKKTDRESDEDSNQEQGEMFVYVDEKTAVPELPDTVMEQIDRINRGELLAEVTGIDKLNHYYALIGTKGIIAQNEETKEMVDIAGEVTLYVPNLIAGLKDVSVLFYGRKSGKWEVISIPEEFVEPEAKMVTLNLPEAGILTVVYRRE